MSKNSSPCIESSKARGHHTTPKVAGIVRESAGTSVPATQRLHTFLL